MFVRLILALVVVLWVSPAWADQTWRVTKPEWTAADETGYSAFVQRIGESSCESDAFTVPVKRGSYAKTRAVKRAAESSD